MGSRVRVLWGDHVDVRFEERVTGLTLFRFRAIAERELELGNFESWWEHDSRLDRDGKERGLCNNKLVRVTPDAWVIFRQANDNPELHVACSAITQQQYDFNSGKFWYRSPSELAAARVAARKHQPLLQNPFAKAFAKVALKKG